jgi:hypothetical protein
MNFRISVFAAFCAILVIFQSCSDSETSSDLLECTVLDQQNEIVANPVISFVYKLEELSSSYGEAVARLVTQDTINVRLPIADLALVVVWGADSSLQDTIYNGSANGVTDAAEWILTDLPAGIYSMLIKRESGDIPLKFAWMPYSYPADLLLAEDWVGHEIGDENGQFVLEDAQDMPIGSILELAADPDVENSIARYFQISTLLDIYASKSALGTALESIDLSTARSHQIELQLQ